MFAKFLVKVAVAGGAVAGAVHLIRKHDLVSKAGVLAEAGVAKAEAGIARGVAYVDAALTRFADDPTPTTGAPAAERPSAPKHEDVTDDVWASATNPTRTPGI